MFNPMKARLVCQPDTASTAEPRRANLTTNLRFRHRINRRALQALLLLLLIVVPAAAHAIVGGYTDVSRPSYHNQVQIFVDNEYECAGTLIGAQWVLTAQHCFTDANLPGGPVGSEQTDRVEVIVGSNQLRGGPLVPIRSFTLFRSFGANYPADAAIIELSVPQAGPYARLGSYPTANAGPALPTGEPVVVRGWGRTSSAQAVAATALKRADGLFTPGSAGGFLMSLRFFARTGMPDKGDSGAGVTIMGLTCGVVAGDLSTNSALRTIYAARTDALEGFIRQVTGIAFNSASCLAPNGLQKITTNIDVEPLGASISQGLKSTDNEGYRADFLSELGSLRYGAAGSGPVDAEITMSVSEKGILQPLRPESPLTEGFQGGLTSGTVRMVGRKRNGSVYAPYNEGYPGYRIDQVAKTALCSVPFYQPNLLSLLVGTNDIQQGFNLASAPSRLEALIKQIITDSPRVVVLVSDLPPNTLSSKPELERNTEAYNQAIPGVVKNLLAQGYHVVFAPSSLSDDQVGPDHIHPTNAGYDQIATGFLYGAQEAVSYGWIQSPDAMGEVPPGCRGPDSSGGGPDSAAYTRDPDWRDTGDWLSAGLQRGDTYRFADMNGDSLADLITIHPDQSWEVTYNHGPIGAEWTPWNDTTDTFAARAPGLKGYNLRFADMDGDGKPDCVGVDRFGGLNVRVWESGKPCGRALPGMDVHTTGTIPGSSYINIVDVNGDGLPDYVVTSQVESGRGSGLSRVWLRKTFDDASEREKEAEAAERNAEQDPANYDDPGSAGLAAYQKAFAHYSPWRSSFTVNPAPDCFGGFRSDGWRWADIYGDQNARLIQLCTALKVFTFPSEAAVPGTTFIPSPTLISDRDFLVGEPAEEFQLADMDGDGKADLIRVNSQTGIRIWLNRLSVPTHSETANGSTRVK